MKNITKEITNGVLVLQDSRETVNLRVNLTEKQLEIIKCLLGMQIMSLGNNEFDIFQYSDNQLSEFFILQES